MLWEVLKSPGSFPFPPSGCCQDTVGMFGLGPGQGNRRRECVGSLRRSGCDVRTLALEGGTGFSLFYPLGSPLWPSGQGLGRLERPALGGRQWLQAPSKDCHTVSQHLYKEHWEGKAPSPPPRQVGGGKLRIWSLEMWVSSYGFIV